MLVVASGVMPPARVVVSAMWQYTTLEHDKFAIPVVFTAAESVLLPAPLSACVVAAHNSEHDELASSVTLPSRGAFVPPALISRACVPAVHDFERDELAMLSP